jgi:hypothetical protein
MNTLYSIYLDINLSMPERNLRISFGYLYRLAAVAPVSHQDFSPISPSIYYSSLMSDPFHDPLLQTWVEGFAHRNS